MEHAGESGVQLSVGAEWKLMVIKQQLQVTYFAASRERVYAGNRIIANVEWYN